MVNGLQCIEQIISFAFFPVMSTVCLVSEFLSLDQEKRNEQ
jgi:hypothetical protein